MKIIYPPRPKGKMLPTDLPHYENGQWLAQRKFRGSRILVHISREKEITVCSRHGVKFSKFDFSSSVKSELLSNLNLEKEKDYWLDGELMNKDVNSTNEVIFFDILQAGNYLFHHPTQLERLEILDDVCNHPSKLCRTSIALEISPNFWMAESFNTDFESRYKESLSNPQIEGLVLRKKKAGLDHLGEKEYETSNIIRCRKPFSEMKGYEF